MRCLGVGSSGWGRYALDLGVGELGRQRPHPAAAALPALSTERRVSMGAGVPSEAAQRRASQPARRPEPRRKALAAYRELRRHALAAILAAVDRHRYAEAGFWPPPPRSARKNGKGKDKVKGKGKVCFRWTHIILLPVPNCSSVHFMWQLHHAVFDISYG